MTFPWEQLPATAEPAQAPATDVIAALQADLRYMALGKWGENTYSKIAQAYVNKSRLPWEK